MNPLYPFWSRFGACIMPYALLGLAGLLVICTSLNGDSAWLLVAAQRVLAGESLYTQIGETNPPLVVWLHVLPVWLGQKSGLDASTCFALLVCLLSGVSVWATARQFPQFRWLALVLAVACGPMAVQVYGQREHLMWLLTLPMMAGLLPGHVPNKRQAFAAAIGMCLKPYFLLWPVGLMMWRCVRHPHWRVLLNPPLLIFAAVGMVYGLYLCIIDRTYADVMLPDLLRYYDAFGAPEAKLLQRILVFGGLFLLPVSFHPAYRPAALLSGGAMVLMVWLQQKGWANHWYPFFALMLVVNAGVVVASYRERIRFVMKFTMMLAALNVTMLMSLNLVGIGHMMQQQWPPYAAAQTRLLNAEKSRTLYPLSFDMAAAFPSSVVAHKQLVSRFAHLWFLASMVRDRQSISPPATWQEQHYFDAVINEMRQLKPQLVVVTERSDYYHPTQGTFAFDFIAYYSQDAGFRTFWSDYVSVANVGPYHYYRRATPHALASAW